MPSDLILYSSLYSWEDMTPEERRDYLAAHLGEDDGNERVARLGLNGGRSV